MTEKDGEKLELSEQSVDQRPNVRPSNAIWNYCNEAAAKRGVQPLDILKELVFVGEVVSKIVEADGALGSVVWKKTDGSEVDLKDLEKNNHTK